MAVASYLKDNDYKQIDFQPYQLNYEAVLKETAAKQQYWLQGVAKVQNAWTSLSELDPINKKNQETLKTFNAETKDQFTKLARTDLSLTENQEQIKNIISPLYDTTNPTSKSILFDSYLNKHYKDEFAKAELLKDKVNKDGSTFYNPSNVRALQLQAQDYYNLKDYQGASDDDLANKMETLFKGKHSYQNYYNPMKEIQQAVKDCPANSISEQSINSQTLTTVTKKEKSASKIFDCVTSMLSPAAISQIQLDGYVRFHNDDGTKNIGALREFYVNNLDRQSKRINEEIASYQGSLARLKNDKEQSELYTQLIKSRQTQLSNIVGEMQKSADDNYILSNFNTLSGQAYKEGFLYKIAEGFSSLDYKQQVEFNEVYLLGLEQKFQRDMKLYEIQNTNQQKQLDRENAMNMTLIKEGKNDPNNPEIFPEFIDANESNTVTKTIVTLNDDFKKVTQEYKDAQAALYSYLATKTKDSVKWNNTPGTEGYKLYDEFRKKYIAPEYIDVNGDGKPDVQKPVDPELTAILHKVAMTSTRKALLNQQYKTVQNSQEYKNIKKEQNAELDKQIDAVFKDKSKLTKNGYFSLGLFQGISFNVGKVGFKDLLNGKTITYDDGSSVKLVDSIEFQKELPTDEDPSIYSRVYKLQIYDANSKKTGYLNISNTPETQNQVKDFGRIFNSTIINSPYNNKINKLYEEKLTENQQVLNISKLNEFKDDNKAHPFQTDIAGILGLKPTSISMISTGNGKTTFSLIKNDPQASKFDYASNGVISKLKKANNGMDVIYDSDKGHFTVNRVTGLENLQIGNENSVLLRQSMSTFKKNKTKNPGYIAEPVLRQHLGNDVIQVDLISSGVNTFYYKISLHKYDSNTGGEYEAGYQTYKEDEANKVMDYVYNLINGTEF